MQVHYIEHVVADPQATVQVLEALGWSFTGPHPEVGDAWLAESGATLLAVRGPLSAQEQPVVRVYTRVDALEEAWQAAIAAGATEMLQEMEIPGRGRIAIYGHGGLELGLWEPASG